MAALAVLAVGCGGSGQGDANTLTLYNAQHQPLAQAWVQDFTAKTGIKVNVRSGSDFELANQIVQEGPASPADVFITENTPAMALVSGKGMFAPLDPATRAQVPAQYSADNGDWVGIAGRSTSFVYNPAAVPAADLPKSIMDLATPAGRARSASRPAEPTSRPSSARCSRPGARPPGGSGWRASSATRSSTRTTSPS
jgi:iron(III) transport system substrate-binding protein